MGTTASVDPEIRRIRALRLRAQGLVPGVRKWRSAPDAARGMLAIQAQDGAAARFALSLRASDRPDDATVLDDLAQRRITRNRPARGTLQITAPEDLHWLSAALTVRSRSEAAKRRPQLGITETMMADAERIIRAELAGGVSRTRPELVAACADAGLPLDNSQTGNILRDLTELMAIVFADPVPKTDVFALADDWIHDRRDPEHALGEAVSRFVGSRGPVTRQDIGKWAYLPMGAVDEGIEAAGGTVEWVTLAGTRYLVAPGTVDLTDAQIDEALARPLMLPGFDEYIIGYGSRAPQLDESHLSRIVPGRNGVFKPMVVIDGEIVGVWSRRATTKSVTVTVEPFTRITAAARHRLAAPVREYGGFLGTDATLA
ncbi:MULTISPECIES: winged helix DNA-binding domain-containing protein [Tsukamurella]|uniref:Winged helix DNA-binding domain-containing protein n=2 Tax=Tsukamurella TaxID=2060 RepID=A0A5C5S548_9ACTN|nr:MULTISPECIES: winged helix DNA-binding domain-containing protein [Tsukamurella]NMD54856.1 winged helix DNA-binding domain-containing protein [Tsukamurella columbiensis]TWS29605.1 winged helix DNA-binding domain-containing protein [Tsukamurella conjunctivitidis]